MHLFSRAVGVMGENPSIDEMLDSTVKKAIDNQKIEIIKSDSTQEYYEAQIDEPMLFKNDAEKQTVGGITIRGLYNPQTKDFKILFYFPYIEGSKPGFATELIVERQADKEAYMVHCDEPKREVTPIFFLRNIVEYLNNFKGKKHMNEKFYLMSGLSTNGKIIFPVKKTVDQIKRGNAAANKRSTLVDKALQGDSEAIENLTIDDYDMISNIYNRIRKEDIFSIVESSFIPSGLECDVYSVVGIIKEVELLTNALTGEEVYYMRLDCNGIRLSVGINRRDLYGQPQPDFRFVGRIWLQGNIVFDWEKQN